MTLYLYNTLHRKKEIFTPMQAGKIKMYVCGMTVYDFCHMGHARMLTAFDVVYRWLQLSGYDVTYVRNITDIDDKIIARAIENQESIHDLTARFIDAMHEDEAALNIMRPTFEPRATDHIHGMLAMIQTLLEQGKAYQADNGDVYYAVRSFENYGALSGRTLDQLRAGERVALDTAKRDPFDFVLWKAAKAGEPAWDSAFGAGRPGWHIECSAMSKHHFGEQFDIHGGGEDLQFPHHENEIAQSEGAHACSYVNYWMHNAFINVDGEKMSKSLGNFFTIRDVLKHVDAETIRFFIVRSHYRSPVNFTDAILKEAKQGLDRLYNALRPFEADLLAKDMPKIDWQTPEAARFKGAMDDDFNTPEAVAVLFELATCLNREPNGATALLLKQLAACLGLLEAPPSHYFKGQQDETFAEEIDALILARQEARLAKNWAESDRIRDVLAEKNIVLEDGADGTRWRVGA
jgi:cysteinyl-tRNA synthetase